MTGFSVAGLARKWCPAMEHSQPYSVADRCCCGELTGALREALEGAERIVMETELVLDESPFRKWTTKGGSFAKQVAAAIAALHKSP